MFENWEVMIMWTGLI